jgi:hypothetical protein
MIMYQSGGQCTTYIYINIFSVANESVGAYLLYVYPVVEWDETWV